MLIKVFVKHYSQKDSHTAIEGVWRVKSEAELLKRLDGQLWYSDKEGDKDEKWTKLDDGCGGLSIDTDNEDLPVILERAKALKLKIVEPKQSWDDYHILGTKPKLMQDWRGDSFLEVSDLFYGATRFDWEIIEGDFSDEVLTALFGDRFYK